MSLTKDDLLDSEDSDSSFDSSGAMATLALLPVTLLGVFSVTNKAAVLSAITALFGGASSVAAVVTAGLWAAGFVTLGLTGMLLVWVVWSIIAALVIRRPPQAAIAVLGTLYFGAASAISHFVFTGLPFIVGFYVASTFIAYGAIIVIGGLAVMGAIAVL